MGIRKSEFVTGLFILAALLTLAFVGVTPFLKSQGQGQVTVYVDFDNVALLKDKALVAVNGIRKGSVEDRHTVNVDGMIKVRVTLRVDEDFIKMCCLGTEAKIAQESLLGDKFVDIIPKLSGEPLQAKDGEYTIPGQDFSDWMTMLSGLTDKIGGIQDLIGNANKLVVNLNDNFLSKPNADNVALMLQDATDLMAETKDAMTKLNRSLDGPDGILTKGKETLSNTADLTGSLKEDYPRIRDQLLATVKKADVLLDSGNARINRIGEILEEANPKLQNILANVDKRLPQTFDGVDHSLSQLDTTLEGADELVRNKDLAAAFYDMRVTLQEMTLTLRALRADFSQIIFGGPGTAQAAVPDPKNKIKDRTDGRPSRYGY